MSVENNKNPTICVVRASDMENEKHEGIDIMKWDAENLSHYNLKEASESLYKYMKEQNMEYLIKKVNHSQFPLKYIYDFFKMFLKIGMTKWTFVEK